jgi:tetratricopeptide (TPR) repeat protein
MNRTHRIALLTALLPLCAAGCPKPTPAAPPRPRPRVNVPPLPVWPAVEPTSSRRFEDAVQVYEALPADSTRRRALRRRLAAYLGRLLPAAMRRGQGLEGVKRYRQLVALHRARLDAFSEGARGDAREAGTPRAAHAPRGAEGSLADPGGVLRRSSRRILRTFKRRGRVDPTLLALAVLERVDPTRRAQWRQEFSRVVAWLGEIEDPLLRSVRGYRDAVTALETVFSRWPSRFVRQHLYRLLVRQHRALRPLTAAPKLPRKRRYRQALAALREFPWQRLRLLVLDGDDARLGRFLEGLKANAVADRRLLQLAEGALASDAGPTAWLRLAEAYAPKWPRFARAVCQRVSQRWPQDPSAHLCLGRLALQDEQTLTAIRHYEAALRAAPDHRQAWEKLSASYLDRLVSLLSQERLEQVQKEVPYLEAFHAAARRRWPADPLDVSLADVYFMLGRGLFNEGRINEAVSTIHRALKLERSPQAYLQLAEILYWRGQYEAAVRRFEHAHKNVKGGSAWRGYWELRTAPQIARARERLAQTLRKKARLASDRATRIKLQRAAKTELASASLLRRRALHVGKLLIANFQNEKLRAEILVHVGWLFWQLGRERIALQSFNAALDQAPERASTYVDVISFLVMRGYFDEALDAYHRALARDEISQYLKAYCTFWILDLGRRAGVDPDRLVLAQVFLKHLQGERWYHQLARFMRGEVSYAELLPKAKTKGHRAELDFYHSMALVRQGRTAEARRLWQRIVDSEMMAFFEYKMVRRYLERGAPKKPVKPTGPPDGPDVPDDADDAEGPKGPDGPSAALHQAAARRVEPIPALSRFQR